MIAAGPMVRVAEDTRERTRAPRASGRTPFAVLRQIFGLEAVSVATSGGPSASNWTAPIAVWSGLCLVAIAIAQTGARNEALWAPQVFWAGFVLLLFPVAARLTWPAVGANERLWLVLVLGEALYVLKIIRSPAGFSEFDEFLHWRTADDIISQGHLFTPNSMLPVSPLYPGMEIVTAAFQQLAGLPTFVVGAVIIGAARACVVVSLFFVVTRLTLSSRTGSLAVLVSMASPTFIFFHGSFAYESLALAFGVSALAVHLAAEGLSGWRRLAAFAGELVLVAALAVTHHVTSFFVAMLFGWMALVACARRSTIAVGLRLLALTAVTIGAIALWQLAIHNPTPSYILPTLQLAITDFWAMLNGQSGGRVLFQSANGAVRPLAERILALASVGLIGLGLLFGYFPLLRARLPDALADYRSNPRMAAAKSQLVAFAIPALFFPGTYVLRLTTTGWEIGNRLGSFLFLSVSVVVAFAITVYGQGLSRSLVRCLVVAGLVCVAIAGGLVTSYGPYLLPGPYLVTAESRSIEPTGIETARWAKEVLGENNVIATDRINRVLMLAYGRQLIVNTLNGPVQTASIFLSPELGPEQLAAIRQARIDYILVDTRLSTQMPFLPNYFEENEVAGPRTAPANLVSLLKFDAVPNVSRIYDNGVLVIYDVRGLRDAAP